MKRIFELIVSLLIIGIPIAIPFLILTWIGTMMAIPLLIWIGIIGILVGVPTGVVVLIWECLAPTNRFFTFVKEATAKAVMKAHEFQRALIQWRGYTLRDDNWEVVSEGTMVAGKTYKEPWHPFGGLRFYGFWPLKDVYIYDLRWTGVTEAGEIQRHPKETLDYILLKDDIYWCELLSVEDSDLLPLHIELLLTIRIINPYKALFKIENWLEAVINRIKPSVRDYVAQDRYKNLVAKKEAMGGEIQGRLKDLIEEFKDLYGVELGKIEVKEIEPPEAQRKETLKKWSAEREKERIEIEAAAEAQRIATIYGAVEAKGKLGELVRALEALEKSPEKGAKWVISFPELGGLLSRVFPGRSVETTKPEELEVLLGPLKKTLEELKREVKTLKQTKKGG